MKIYFSASVLQKPGVGDSYNQIVQVVKSFGCEVVTTLGIFDMTMVDGQNKNNLEKVSFLGDWEAAVKKTDIAILEVSHPSTVNVGVELVRLIDKGRPVVCLYREGKCPSFVDHDFSNRLIRLEYDPDNLREVINYGLEEARSMINRRFTFYISGKIENFLDNMAKKTGVNRSEYIRNLIEEKMETY